MAIHEQLLAAVGDRRGVGAADRLCEACVVLFGVDAAAISLVFDGTNVGTLGASGVSARVYDELQFTLGEGRAWTRWPTARRWWWSIWPIPMFFGGRRMGRAILAHQIRGVYAMPVVVAGRYVGALDLFWAHPVCWVPSSWPVRWWRPSWPRCRCWISSQKDLQAAVADPDSDSWAELNTLSRAEVSQATGILVAQLEVEPAEAVVRLRAHAFATGRSATAVACDILDRRLRLEAD